MELSIKYFTKSTGLWCIKWR